MYFRMAVNDPLLGRSEGDEALTRKNQSQFVFTSAAPPRDSKPFGARPWKSFCIVGDAAASPRRPILTANRKSW
jgi:hypothetical protein